MKKFLETKLFLIAEAVLIFLYVIFNIFIARMLPAPEGTALNCPDGLNCIQMSINNPWITIINWILLLIFFVYLLIFATYRIYRVIKK